MKNRSSLKRIQLLPLLLVVSIGCSQAPAGNEKKADVTNEKGQPRPGEPARKIVDTAAYDKIIRDLSNGDTTGKWPAKAPYPLAGAILPFNRIVAYYGNLFSKKMGILGELPKKQMLAKLKGEVAKWQAADPSIPVIPALHYVAVTAQGTPQKDNMYRYRMPFKQIDTIVSWAKEINAQVFVDIQVAHSDVKTEVPLLEPYLKMPNVHLGIDPEFSLKNGEIPGSKIGTFNAADINSAIDYLAEVVRKNNIPPKILIIHRFTQGMVTGFDQIKKVPEVQIVMDMDGWGPKFLKRSTYLRYIKKEPVQFTGFKLFYHNDTKTGANQLYTPQELLQFTPKPIYIQYQ
ncbi:hypothetical protein [Segetibacter sp.]|jgi:hypothetical protein|uniref:hypothetical protein n=1 Tax=Segetibacter sp. TaxID=2231182 RepID=UPI00261194C7|nr:hypothetical protein [Segetibacter sp.]MCW3079583.1 hypothetical protein [Segetibacter sp.]